MIAGAYETRFASSPADVEAAQRLRHMAFFTFRDAPGRPDGRDADDFDDRCLHLLVEDRKSGTLVATLRLLPLGSGAQIRDTYSAQYYDLDALRDFDRPMIEMGRFCMAPGQRDPNILRAALAAVTRLVDREGAELLFGCSSFHGTDTAAYADAFAMLKEGQGPECFPLCAGIAPQARPCTRVENHAAFAAKLSDDGWLGQRSCGGRPRSEHAPCCYGA